MDVTTLAPVVLPYLVRYLPAMIEAGKFVGGKALEKIVESATDEGWKIVQPWIGKLMGKIEDKPAALNAAQRVASSPENEKYQTALEVELEEIFSEDRDLAEEIKRILDQAKAGDQRLDRIIEQFGLGKTGSLLNGREIDPFVIAVSPQLRNGLPETLDESLFVFNRMVG